MNKVRLHLRKDIELILTEASFPSEEKPKVKIINGWSDDAEGAYPPTLKDLSVILYSMVGCGVTWELAYEISKRLEQPSKNPYEISETINEIIRDYFEMSEDKAWEKREESPSLHAPNTR